MKKYTDAILSLFKRSYPREVLVLFALFLLLTILIVPLFLYERSLQISLNSYRSKLNELTLLSNEYKILHRKISFIEGKTLNPQMGGITNVINDLVQSIGIKHKVKSIKDVTSRQLKGDIIEESADLIIEKVTLNELINIYHKIQTMPVIFTIKRTNIKKTFERPELLDLSITLAIYHLPQESKR